MIFFFVVRKGISEDGIELFSYFRRIIRGDFHQSFYKVDKNHEINLSPILMMTFKEIEDNPVNGEYWEYYCYHCNSFVEKFIITENNNDFKKEKITKDIESLNDSIKIIKFEKTENDFLDSEVCPECGNNIEKLTHDSECPKCHNGKLYATFSIMMD